MSKQISNIELATIVSDLLTKPESVGQLDEASTFSSFMTAIAEVVADHCGGEVMAPADTFTGGWLVGIGWNDSVPDDDGIWAAYDKEADFNPESRFSEDCGQAGIADHYSTHILTELRDHYGWKESAARDEQGALLSVEREVHGATVTLGFFDDPSRRRYIAVKRSDTVEYDLDCRDHLSTDVAESLHKSVMEGRKLN